MIRKSNISKGKLSSFNRIQKNLEAVKNMLRAENVKARDTKKSEQDTSQENIVYEDTSGPKKRASRKEIKAQEEKLLAESMEKAGVDYSQIKKPKNLKLTNARKAKNNDEFYTRLSDVENELRHYTEHFEGKTVLCNCDDPTWSAFWKYFHMNFSVLGIKKLIGTHYETEKPNSYAVVYEGGNDGDTNFYTKYVELEGNGDFRSDECIEYLKECDIVATNPPFSLAREFIRHMFTHTKKFVVVGDLNWLTYKDVFPHIVHDRMWAGYCNIKEFGIKIDYLNGDCTDVKKFGNKMWFTNLPIKKRKEDLILTKTYNSIDYPKYDNYDAINVYKVKDIPLDYYGVMGVPISFIDKYNPDQFEIVGLTLKSFSGEYYTGGLDTENPVVKGLAKYRRMLIAKRKKSQEE